MKASSGAGTISPILSGRWMLHIMDVRATESQPPQLLRRGIDRDAIKLDLAEKCRGYADAIIIDLAVRQFPGLENADVQGSIAKVCQTVLNVHRPSVKNWRMFESQLKHRTQNLGAFARAGLLTLEMDALANLVEWAAVLTACVLNIGQANFQSNKKLSRPPIRPHMNTFSGRIVEWRHCAYAAFALASLRSDLSSDDKWAKESHVLAADAGQWDKALQTSGSREDLSARQLLQKIVGKRASILPRKEIIEKQALLNRDTNNVDELLELDAAWVSRELQPILENAHILPRTNRSGEES